MIVKMKKLTLICTAKEQDRTLEPYVILKPFTSNTLSLLKSRNR